MLYKNSLTLWPNGQLIFITYVVCTYSLSGDTYQQFNVGTSTTQDINSNTENVCATFELRHTGGWFYAFKQLKIFYFQSSYF